MRPASRARAAVPAVFLAARCTASPPPRASRCPVRLFPPRPLRPAPVAVRCLRGRVAACASAVRSCCSSAFEAVPHFARPIELARPASARLPARRRSGVRRLLPSARAICCSAARLTRRPGADSACPDAFRAPDARSGAAGRSRIRRADLLSLQLLPASRKAPLGPGRLAFGPRAACCSRSTRSASLSFSAASRRKASLVARSVPERPSRAARPRRRRRCRRRSAAPRAAARRRRAAARRGCVASHLPFEPLQRSAAARAARPPRRRSAAASRPRRCASARPRAHLAAGGRRAFRGRALPLPPSAAAPVMQLLGLLAAAPPARASAARADASTPRRQGSRWRARAADASSSCRRASSRILSSALSSFCAGRVVDLRPRLVVRPLLPLQLLVEQRREILSLRLTPPRPAPPAAVASPAAAGLPPAPAAGPAAPPSRAASPRRVRCALQLLDGAGHRLDRARDAGSGLAAACCEAAQACCGEARGPPRPAAAPSARRAPSARPARGDRLHVVGRAARADRRSMFQVALMISFCAAIRLSICAPSRRRPSPGSAPRRTPR